jgi:cytochrome c oxidase subunit 2
LSPKPYRGITGGDVIRQWVAPSFGARADGIPGRNNPTWFVAKETGTYYGECSALCGQPYMPIAVKIVSNSDFRSWVSEKQKSAASTVTKSRPRTPPRRESVNTRVGRGAG